MSRSSNFWTGVFDDDRYFDVFVEYAKYSPTDLLMQISVHNRGPQEAALDVLPQLWFRNTWSWSDGIAKPELRALSESSILANHQSLGEYYFEADRPNQLLFCDNETNTDRVFNFADGTRYGKDAFHDAVVSGEVWATNPARIGTKAAAHYRLTIPAGSSESIRVRLSRAAHDAPFEKFDEAIRARAKEADEYYAELQRDVAIGDCRNVQRQAFAGLIWSQQVFTTTCGNG